MASTDAAGRFFYHTAAVVWRRTTGGMASDGLLFAMQKLFHVGLFCGFGVVSGAGGETPRRRWLFGIGVAICVASEMAQMLTASRSPSWMDGVLNVACFSGGAAVGQLRRARESSQKPS